MITLFYAAFLLQGAMIAADEILFHRRRPMPLWERWGHPLDTSVFLLAIVLLWWLGPGWLSVTAAVISTLIITKDESVHARLCGGAEQWVHSMLFILHPVVFYLAHLSWGQWGLEIPVLLVGFLLYQTLYWNVYADRPLES